MKKTLVAVATLALFGGAGCSSISTNVDYDPATNFASYKTYAFKDVHGRGEFQMKRVEAAIEKDLAARGLTKVPAATSESKPDLWVVLHARLKNDKQITSYNAGWGWGWHGWGGGGISTARVYDVPVGTLIVDLVDTKEKELVWRGVASRDVGASETPQERAEVTQEAVDKLFEGFPPKH